MFICGRGSSWPQDMEEPEPKRSRTRRGTSFCKPIVLKGKSKASSKKNCFAHRGLDKFHALLDDLDRKKQRIYTQKAADEISLVRFVYTSGSGGGGAKPIVVKDNIAKRPDQKSASSVDQVQVSVIPKNGRVSGSLSMDSLRQPFFYLPLVLVLVLAFLVIYGRSFVILCASIGWYMVPTAAESSEREPKRKKTT